MFKLIVPSYQCLDWLPGNFESIANQSLKDFDVCVVDDASDKAQKEFIDSECRNLGWECVLNLEHRGSMYSQAKAIDVLSPSDDDIIVVVDGDDRLKHNDVLKKVKSVYDEEKVQLTFGSYVCSDGYKPHMQDYPDRVVNRNRYRRCGELRFNHLRTFSFSLYKHLDHEKDFKWPDGTWFEACPDTAIMIPCLELSGGNYKFIDEVLYEYNVNNPISDWKVRSKVIDKTHKYILGHLKTKRPLNGIKVRGENV